MKRAHHKSNLQKVTDLPWVTSEFTSCLTKARGVEDEILEVCRKNGFSDHDLFALKLAIEEALVNACKHGNCMDTTKRVKVQYRVTPQRADIAIEDEGAGFNPGELPDPTAPENLETCHGRGILLMRAYMSNVVFNPSGNRVTLTKFNESHSPSANSSQAAMG